MFGIPRLQLGLLVGARTIGSAIGQPPMGALADSYGRRCLLPVGFVVMGGGITLLAAIPFGSSDDVTVEVAGRGLNGRFVSMVLAMRATGIGSSVVHPTGHPLQTANVDAGRKGKVLGLRGVPRSSGRARHRRSAESRSRW